jgi:hypothetical protein
MRKGQIILTALLLLAVAGGVLAAVSTSYYQAICTMYTRAPGATICTVTLHAATTVTRYPGQPAWGTTFATTVPGPCTTVVTYYACS